MNCIRKTEWSRLQIGHAVSQALGNDSRLLQTAIQGEAALSRVHLSERNFHVQADGEEMCLLHQIDRTAL